MGANGGSERRARGVAPTEAMRAQVERLTGKVRVAHLARAVCAGLAAFAVTLTLAVIGGTELWRLETVALAAGVGAVAGLTWRLGLAIEPAGVARDLDRSLSSDGALLAAYEASVRGSAGGVAELGAARVFRTLDRGRAEAAVVPHSLGFVALPVLAFAALALAVEARTDRALSQGRALARATGAVQGAEEVLARASAEGEDAMASEAAEAAAQAIQEAAAALAGGDGDDAAREEAMSRLGEALDELAREAADPELAEALRELAMDAELHGAAVPAEEPAASAADGSAGAGDAVGDADSDGPGGSGADEGDDGPAGTSAPAPGDGEGPGAAATGPVTGPTSAAPRPAVPARYRDLLRRWASRSEPGR